MPPSPSPPPTGDWSGTIANCAAIGTGADLRTSLAGLRYLGDDDGFPREIVVATDAERDTGLRFWPLHGTVVDGLVHLFYVGVETTDASTTWGFREPRRRYRRARPGFRVRRPGPAQRRLAAVAGDG